MSNWKEDPETPQELLAYILEYQDSIYVWQGGENKALSELDPVIRANWILDWLGEGFQPHRFKELVNEK